MRQLWGEREEKRGSEGKREEGERGKEGGREEKKGGKRYSKKVWREYGEGRCVCAWYFCVRMFVST
jgi:hypothetical protein